MIRNYGLGSLMLVTVEELKQQMRVDFDEEDELIRLYGVAAQDTILNMIRRDAEELEIYDRDDGEAKIAAPVKTAILILAAHLYKNREPVSSVAQNAVPYSISVLIKPFVRLSERGYNEIEEDHL